MSCCFTITDLEAVILRSGGFQDHVLLSSGLEAVGLPLGVLQEMCYCQMM